VQTWHRADIWCSDSLSRSEWWKISRTEWWLIADLHQSRMVHRSSICVLSGWREIVWSENVLVSRKEACRPATISHYLACCSSLVCSAKLFANFVDNDDSPTLGLNGLIFQFFGSRMFSGAPRKLYRRVAFCDCCEVGGKLCQHDSLELKKWPPGSLCVNSARLILR
jgi:hypothetical protein